ncbi:MAG: sigma-70 family RNA polymerase sigma factor [Eubacteriales bacterium]|nr:sigma-70 family RNA polymerase sigma factor [Eubacteriales bacterium]
MFESDKKMIDGILERNDREAAEMLVGKYYKYIYKEIYRRITDEELAMDLTQETFITILKNLYQFDESKSAFKTWITRIAGNKVIDYSRSRQSHERSATQTIDGYDREDGQNVEMEVCNRLAAARLKEHLRYEREEDKQIFMLKAEQGYTFEEIAGILGIKSMIAKNRYYSVIKRMRKELSDFE